MKVLPKDLVSIVVPVRNGLPYLVTAIESALANQSVDFDLEVIIVENFSSDGTSDYLKTLVDPRVEIVRPDRPLSAAENWTLACQSARGEFIKLLCADDLITEGGLVRQFNVLQLHPNSALVASRRRVIDERGAQILKSRGVPCEEGVHDGREIIGLCWKDGTNILGESASVLFRREPLLKALPWDGGLPYLLDLSLYFKVLATNSVVISHETDAAFRVHPVSLSNEIGSAQAGQFVRFFKDHYARESASERRGYYFLLFQVLIRAYANQFARAFFYAFINARNASGRLERKKAED